MSVELEEPQVFIFKRDNYRLCNFRAALFDFTLYDTRRFRQLQTLVLKFFALLNDYISIKSLLGRSKYFF